MSRIVRGTNWQGSYSRFSSDELKRYFAMLKEQGKPVLDDEFNTLQEMLLDYVSNSFLELVGNGSAGQGALIVGTGAANNFTVRAGTFYIAGLRLLIPADFTYTTQEIASPALTTPGANRTDTVYMEAWLDEVGPAEDPAMVDPTLNAETSRRLKLRYRIAVAQGVAAPTTYVAGDGITHHIVPLATLARTATAAINAGMVTDLRPRNDVLGRIATHSADPAAHAGPISATVATHNVATSAHRQLTPVGMVSYFIATAAPAGWLHLDGRTIGSAASGATARANNDVAELYTVLWNLFSNTLLPIQNSGGGATTRGASAAADFAANKRLPLPDDRGEFYRASDFGRGIDPSRAFGSLQADAFESHSHTTDFNHSRADGGDGSRWAFTYPGASGDVGPSPSGPYDSNDTGGTETRPRNRAYMTCVKY